MIATQVKSQLKILPKPLYPHQILWFCIRFLLVVIIITYFIGIMLDMKLVLRKELDFTYHLFWHLGIPLMVMIIYFAPMFWRNICPLATINLWYFVFFHRKKLSQQGISANELTGIKGKIWQFLRKRGMLFSVLLFWLIVPLRLILFDDNNIATALLLMFIYGGAAIMGYFFPVKSGWCTSICPVNAVEKTYSINPAIYLKNYRCHFYHKTENKIMSCSGCSFNCMDVVEPEHAYWQAQSKKIFHDTLNAKMRKVFIAAFPGFITAYAFWHDKTELLSEIFAVKVLTLYSTFALSIMITSALYFGIKNYLRQRVEKSLGPLTIETPSTRYSLYKRRLDLIYITLAINLFWYLSSREMVTEVLTGFIPLPEFMQYFLWSILLVIVAFLSFYGLQAGWNESFKTTRHKPSWW